MSLNGHLHENLLKWPLCDFLDFQDTGTSKYFVLLMPLTTPHYYVEEEIDEWLNKDDVLGLTLNNLLVDMIMNV
jgi:hypothetical protein